MCSQDDAFYGIKDVNKRTQRAEFNVQGHVADGLIRLLKQSPELYEKRWFNDSFFTDDHQVEITYEQNFSHENPRTRIRLFVAQRTGFRDVFSKIIKYLNRTGAKSIQQPPQIDFSDEPTSQERKELGITEEYRWMPWDVG